MKKLFIALLMILTLAGCTTETQYGQCIGAFDDKNPALTYKPSGWNIGLAVVFVETIIVPIVVIMDETLCPNGVVAK